MAVGEDIDDVEAVKGDAVCSEGNTAQLLLIVLLEGMAVGEDVDGVEAVKENAVCGEENVTELLLVLLLEYMAVGGDSDGVEVSEGWGMLEGMYVIVIFVSVLSIGVTV